ncbi:MULTISPECIES: S8 family peptidase [Kribbella]|nr:MULTISPECIES: S8 family peptidase [Kribbella]
MPSEPRYFLGYGERLTGRVPPPPGGRGTEPPYTLEEAVERLAPRLGETVDRLDELPAAACPREQVVAVMTMHPQAVAKSYFPAQLLNQYGLWHVGSRPVLVTPEQWTRQDEVAATPSTDLFIAGRRESFNAFAQALHTLDTAVPEGLRRIEDIHPFTVAERVRGLDARDSIARTAYLEVVLHAADTGDDGYIVEAFAEYADQLGVDARLGMRLYAGGLCFIPVVASVDQIDGLSQFSFLRVARPVSRMRDIATPIERSVPSPDLPDVTLPTEGPLDPDFRVAVFDGGLADGSPLAPWAVGHDTDGVGKPVDTFLGHGHEVTSALLFGSLAPGAEVTRPYCTVDHFRVLDDSTEADPFELYDVLGRIQKVLSDRRYEFFNLSLGPHVPTENDEVHPWTAVLDEHLADGHAFASIAVGNSGATSEPRIQVPSDCVNGVSVGAADSTGAGWTRAPYSGIGPGRSPGVVKPDLLNFGGSATQPFLVIDRDSAPSLSRTSGTSLAAPSLLRQAVGLRAHFGSRLSPLALKALLIHAADPQELLRHEVGWGKTPSDLDEIAVCSDGMVRVIYQGELSPRQFLRAVIPTPAATMAGFVTLRATFCYATPVDPQDPGNYTRAGLEVTFRPHAERFKKDDAVDPAPHTFFKRTEFDPEHDLRKDAQKWETILHHEQRFRGTSLMRPVFDIHYNAREGGGEARHAPRMRYALVVDVLSPRTPDLYDRVSALYAGQLEALVPLVDIPVQVQT